MHRSAKKEPKDPGGHKWKGPFPKGWTDASRKKFWGTLTGRAPKHKVTECIKRMEGKVSDPGAFCAALADRVIPGWRAEAAKERKNKKAALLTFEPQEIAAYGAYAERWATAEGITDPIEKAAKALSLAGDALALNFPTELRREAAVFRARVGLTQPLRTRRDYGETDEDDEGPQHSKLPGSDNLTMEEDRRVASQDWITRDEMEKLCPSCAARMRKAGFTRVHTSVMRRMLAVQNAG